jgi:hypothetical protein
MSFWALCMRDKQACKHVQCISSRSNHPDTGVFGREVNRKSHQLPRVIVRLPLGLYTLDQGASHQVGRGMQGAPATTVILGLAPVHWERDLSLTGRCTMTLRLTALVGYIKDTMDSTH